MYSWKSNRPDIKILTSPMWTPDRKCLVVDVQNTGGSAITIKGVWVYDSWKRKFAPGIINKILLQRVYVEGHATSAEKDSLPHTIQPYDSETWMFDASHLIGEWAKSQQRPKKFMIEVTPATGRKAMGEIEVSFLSNTFDEIESHPFGRRFRKPDDRPTG